MQLQVGYSNYGFNITINMKGGCKMKLTTNVISTLVTINKLHNNTKQPQLEVFFSL